MLSNCGLSFQDQRLFIPAISVRLGVRVLRTLTALSHSPIPISKAVASLSWASLAPSTLLPRKTAASSSTNPSSCSQACTSSCDQSGSSNREERDGGFLPEKKRKMVEIDITYMQTHSESPNTRVIIAHTLPALVHRNAF